jgi:N-acyl-D-amino-acid deacylase
MVTAREAGFEIDEPLLAEQLEFTRQSFIDRKDDIARGQNVGGRSATVGYALWMFDVCRAERDEITDALAAFLLVRQEDDGRWQPPSKRPPMEESPVPCTLFAAYGLEKYAPETRRADAESAIERARTWLASAPMTCQDDLVSRLWFLHLLGNDPAAVESARTELLTKQHADGGWSQTDELASDAYATGQALYVLRLAGLARDDASLRRGVEFLIKTQEPDGSWHVVTRSKPIQTWFDNGDPHGTDQFISTPATCWAVAALSGLETPRDR